MKKSTLCVTSYKNYLIIFLKYKRQYSDCHFSTDVFWLTDNVLRAVEFVGQTSYSKQFVNDTPNYKVFELGFVLSSA